MVGETLLFGELVQPHEPQEGARVLGGGGGRDEDAGLLDRQHEAQGVRVLLELLSLDQLDDHLLLVVAVLPGSPLGVGHAEVLQRCLGALEAWLAGHLPLVDLRRELLGRIRGLTSYVAPLVLHQLTQPLAPRLLVGRVNQHAVHVEDSATKTHMLSFLTSARGWGRPSRRGSLPLSPPGFFLWSPAPDRKSTRLNSSHA